MKRIEPGWGKPYGGDEPWITPRGGQRWMYRKGQRVRFFDSRGRQVGPEQSNVVPAIAAAFSMGWCDSVATGANSDRF